MSNFFQDTINKFRLLPEVGKQLWKTAESQATAKKVATKLAEVQTPTSIIKPLKLENFFGDIAQKFNLTKPQEFIKPQPAPMPRVITDEDRARTERVKETIINIARSFPREGAGAVLEIQEKLTGVKGITLKPETKIEKFLFGEKPVESLSKQGKDVLKSFGVSELSSKQFGLTTGLVMLGLDLLPPGGKDVVRLLAKANKVDDVVKILKTLKGVDSAKITDDVVKIIAKTSDTKQITKLVEGLKVTEVVKGLEPLAQEARKYKSAEEYIMNYQKEKTAFINEKAREAMKFERGYQAKTSAARRKSFDIAEMEWENKTKEMFGKKLDIYNEKSQLTDLWNKVSKGKGLAPGVEAKITRQVGEELAPKAQPILQPPTTLPQSKVGQILKETGESYTTKELSSDTLYQKTGVLSTVAKRADEIAKELTKNPTKWNRFTKVLRSSATSFKEKIVNDWQRVKELSEKPGLKLTGDLTPYERRKLMAGRQTARLQKTEEIVRKIDKDILNTSKELKIKDSELQNEVFDYLKARHAPERNAVLGEKAAGITTEEATKRLVEFEKFPHAKEIKRIADDLQKFHNETLDILYQKGKPEGVISKELYETLKNKYKNHIPLNRVMDTDDIGEVLSGRGLAVKGTGLKRAVGSEREVKDILENIYTARTQAIQRVEKNIVDNETYQFVEDYIKSFPEQELFEVIKPGAIGKTFDGRVITKQITDPTVLQFQRNGKPAFIKVNDTRLAVALRGVNREQLPGLMRYVSTVTRWMSALVTRYNPEFVLSNKVRDLQEAIVYTSSQLGFKSGVKGVARDPGSLNDVKNFLIGKETEGTKLYKQMIEDGGTTGGLALSTRKQIETSLEEIRKTSRSNPKKAFKTLVDSVDNWNRVFEDSTRLSAYKEALKKGLSREKAAIQAKNVSIDFNEFGTWGPIINSLYMFSNASIQGSAKMIRAMKNPKVATAVVGTVGASVFAVNEWNDFADPEWKTKVSKWDRLNGFNIVIPGTEEFHYVSVPVSWGLKPIKVAMEYGSDLSNGKGAELQEAAEGILVALMEGYNPVGGTDLASALTPSPIEPFIDISRNREWSGGKIRPDWVKYAPASTQYFKDLRDSKSGELLIKLSEEVSEKTGGRIEFSPANAEYLFQQATGGPGRFTAKIFNSISAIGKKEMPEPRDIPFVSRILRKTPEERFYVSQGEEDILETLTEQERVRFYNRQEAEKIFEELKKMPPGERKETYLRLKKETPEIIERVDKIASDEEKNLTRLDRQILDLGVENGARAKYLYEVFKSAEPEERKELYLEYVEKGIISKDVKKQLDYLFKNGN